jgi:hypothetical protein
MNKAHIFIFLLYFLITFVEITKAETGFKETDSLKAGDTITVTGIALNAKLGAIVQTDNSTYYVEGLESWSDIFFKKGVEVKGILKTETHKEEDLKDDKGNYIQGMVGEKRTITQAVWKIIEK